jgi:hypothetical protein
MPVTPVRARAWREQLGGEGEEMPVVTMSGTIASGAREIGRAAASLLGTDYVDQQLLVDAARRLGVHMEVMAGREGITLEEAERHVGVRDRAGAAFG